MKSMQASQTWHERAERVIPGPHSNLPGYELFKPIYLTHGQGMHLWDADGTSTSTTCRAWAQGSSATATRS